MVFLGGELVFGGGVEVEVEVGILGLRISGEGGKGAEFDGECVRW